MRLLMLLICCAVRWAAAQEYPLMQHTVLTLTPAELPVAENRQIAGLSLMSWRDGDFVPIPFQIDEINRIGMVWLADTGFAHQGAAGRFDEKDQLLFMFADAGAPAPADARPEQGTVLAEITLIRPDDEQVAVYLVADNPQRSELHYVSHDPLTGVTRTQYYVLTTDPDNELNWRHLGYTGYRGRADASLIDTLKMRMSAGLLFRFPRVTLDNDNLQPNRTGFAIGPIRSVMHLETRVVFAGLPMMKLHVQAHRYANHYEAHSYARIPKVYRNALKAPRVAVSIDGNDLLGARVRSARSNGLTAYVDGQMDGDEEKLVARGLSSTDSWILFDSGKGFALLTELEVPAELRDIPLELIYQDDQELRLKPEQYPGQLPNVGYALTAWPQVDELSFAVRLLFDQSLLDLQPAEYVAQRTGRALRFRVRALP